MPISLNGTNGVTFPDNSLQAAAASPFGLKNRIINGDMVISQRNGTSSVTLTNATFTYTLDRWSGYTSQTSRYAIQQNAGSVTPPAGFTNYLGVTSLSAYSVISSDLFMVTQPIEGFNVADLGWGTANARTVTVSFWVRSSLTGTFGGSLLNSAGNRSYPFTYTINAANTWEQKSVTIPGDTTGTWLTNNSIGIYLSFSLGTGSSFSGPAGAWAGSQFWSATGTTSVVGTNGATLYITGVQLEQNTSATPFERRMYGQELALCQRYLPAFISSSTSDVFGFGYSTNTTDVIAGYKLPVTARVQPTGVTVSSASHFVVATGSGGTATANAASFIMGNQDVVMMLFTRTGLTGGQGSYVAANSTSAKLLFTGCEL